MADLFSWKYIFIFVYAKVILALHMLKYFPISIWSCIIVSFVFGVLVAVFMSRSGIARRVLLLTAPQAFCRSCRIFLLSLATVEGIFRPIINISFQFIKASQCASKETVSAGQKLLDNILKAIVGNIPKAVQQISNYLSNFVGGIVGMIFDPFKLIRNEFNFKIEGHANSSMELDDDNMNAIVAKLDEFANDIQNVTDFIKIITGIVSLIYVLMYIPFKKYRQMHMVDPLNPSTQSSIFVYLKAVWGRIRKSFNPISNLTFTLGFTFLIERLFIYVYFICGNQYLSKPPKLGQNSSLQFTNNGSALGDVVSNALNDVFSANLTDQVQVNVSSCYKHNVEYTSLSVYIGYSVVIILTCLTNLLEDKLKDEDTVLLFFAEA